MKQSGCNKFSSTRLTGMYVSAGKFHQLCQTLENSPAKFLQHSSWCSIRSNANCNVMLPLHVYVFAIVKMDHKTIYFVVLRRWFCFYSSTSSACIYCCWSLMRRNKPWTVRVSTLLVRDFPSNSQLRKLLCSAQECECSLTLFLHPRAPTSINVEHDDDHLCLCRSSGGKSFPFGFPPRLHVILPVLQSHSRVDQRNTSSSDQFDGELN